MIKLLCLVILSLTCACHSIQCYNGQNYVDIPESKLSDVGYTEYNITHSNFDCKIAYKRYLKIKEIEPVVHTANNPLSVAEHRNDEKKMIITLAGIGIFALFVIWVIKLTISCFRENTDSVDSIRIPSKKCSAESLKSHDYLGVHQFRSPIKEHVKSWDDLSREYSENLRKLEQERATNAELPIIVDTTIKKSTTPTYEELLLRPEWRQFRKRAFKRYGRTCAICGRSECRLNVHHNYYLKDYDGFVYPWEYPLTAVSILCEECHHDWHQSHKVRIYSKFWFNCTRK